MQRISRLSLLAALVVAIGVPATAASNPWYVSLADSLRGDAAIEAAVADIETTGAPLGEAILRDPVPDGATQVILVGDAASHPAIAALAVAGDATPLPDDPQGFSIRTFRQDGRRTIVITGGSIAGHVYGLYWLWDRMRVHGAIPDINTTRTPALKVRHMNVENDRELRQALRYTATWASGHNALGLIPWGVSPEDVENAANRERLQPLIDGAHAYHLKYLVYCDEFSYHPEWFAAQGATLDLDDPKLWEALQTKYRALLTTLPALDGVRIRTGEHTRVGGNYRPLDIMHEPENAGWPLDRRYRTFVQKLHAVVVGEFNKIYFHRTWVANAREQHSDPVIYRAIFTESVPVEDLWLSPYMSLADRWYYQPYNPTFNQTPHNMMVLLSSLDYHAAGNEVFPSFPGQYHQGGMLHVLDTTDSNMKGVHFGMPGREGWDTQTLTGYVAFRLAWEPWADLNAIARDFASIHLGPEAATEMGRALLLSHQAYQDGIYIKPVAEGIVGNTLPHLRLTTFQLQGIPEIDGGRAHVEWLRQTMLEPCRGREAEALAYFDLGLAAARAMEQASLRARPLIRDGEIAGTVVRGAAQTRWLVEANRAYVNLCFAYFDWLEHGAQGGREALTDAAAHLREVCKQFRSLENFSYRLYGIDQLLSNADAALVDRDAAMRSLADAPDVEGTYALIEARQASDREKLAAEDHGYTKVLRWRGQVDGKDILHIRGSDVRIEHLASDDIQSEEVEFSVPLPEKAVEVVLRDVESQDMHPFVLAQPSAANNYTASVYLFDRPPGYGWWEFELYFRE